MTEAECLSCADPEAMLDFLGDGLSDRRARLFACACCRRVWHLVVKAASREAVEAAELYADGLTGEDALDGPGRGSYSALSEVGRASDIAHRLAEGGELWDWEQGEAWALERAIAARGYRHARAYAEAANAAHASAGGPDGTGRTMFARWAAGPARRAVGYQHMPAEGPDLSAGYEAEDAEASRQCGLLRDIFGNPFRPVSINPAWLTADVVALAQ